MYYILNYLVTTYNVSYLRFAFANGYEFCSALNGFFFIFLFFARKCFWIGRRIFGNRQKFMVKGFSQEKKWNTFSEYHQTRNAFELENNLNAFELSTCFYANVTFAEILFLSGLLMCLGFQFPSLHCTSTTSQASTVQGSGDEASCSEEGSSGIHHLLSGIFISIQIVPLVKF